MDDKLLSVLNPFSTYGNDVYPSLLNRCLNGKCSYELHYIMPPVLTFAIKTLTLPQALERIILIPIVFFWRDVSSLGTVSSHEPLPCGSDSYENSSPITTILACSRLGFTDIFLIYSHKLCLLQYHSLPRAPFFIKLYVIAMSNRNILKDLL